MKRNVKFFTIVISLLLASTLLLVGCMYAIAADNGEMKPYDLNEKKENSDVLCENVLEDAPQGQMPMHGKFSEYLHKDGNTVTVFSESQYAELKAVRDSNKRDPLTYEEILFLVSDSINMYFAYDKISLYNANADGILPLTLSFSSLQSSSDCIIEPYHGDFSEFVIYADALNRYERMIQEIYAIIYYRIYMHDAGFARVYRAMDNQIWGESTADDPRDSIAFDCYQLLAIDDATDSGIANEEKLIRAYETLVEWEIEVPVDYIDPDKKIQSLDAPILCTEIWHSTRTLLEYQFCIYEQNDRLQIIYPTKELTAMKPQRAVNYQAGEEGEPQPIVRLNYVTGGAYISQGFEFSFAMVGKFDLHDDVLKVYFGESELNPDYWYVFYKTDEGLVFSAADSKIAVGIGRDWADGLVFKEFQEHAVVQPEIIPPSENEDNEPTPAYEEWAYLKYVFNGDYCTLMSSDGSTLIAEGSYVKEADKLVFMFKTADGVYTYYFHYREDSVYVFNKALSEAFPGYGFEDEMEFTLTEYDGGSCFLEFKKD